MVHMSVAAVCTFVTCTALLFTTHGDVQFKPFTVARGWHISKRGGLQIYYTDLHRCIYTCMKTDKCLAIGYSTKKKECKLTAGNLFVEHSYDDDDITVIVQNLAVIAANFGKLFTFAEVEEACNTLGVRLMTKDEFVVAAGHVRAMDCRCGWVDSGQQFAVLTTQCGGPRVIECTGNRENGGFFLTKHDDY